MAPRPRPGFVGRAIRFAVGAAEVAALCTLVLVWREPMWSGVIPDHPLLIFLLAFALRFSGAVVRIPLDRPQWENRPAVWVTAGAVVAATLSWVTGGSIVGPVLSLYLWVWLVAFLVLLAPAHLLAAILATPGCEMHAYAHLKALIRRESFEVNACEGGIDRFDNVRLS